MRKLHHEGLDFELRGMQFSCLASKLCVALSEGFLHAIKLRIDPHFERRIDYGLSVHIGEIHSSILQGYARAKPQ